MSLESQLVDMLSVMRPRCAVNNFALIANMSSPARVASALKGDRPFDSQDGLLYVNVLRKMVALQDMVAPLPIDWSETETIKGILAAISAKTLHISVCEEQPVAKPEPQFYIFLPGQKFLFVRRSPDYADRMKISGNFQSAGATRMTKACADQVVSELKSLGHEAQPIVSKITSESVVDDFESVWGIAEQV
jgi:hypothetical protein